jgi:hypothetical protein
MPICNFDAEGEAWWRVITLIMRAKFGRWQTSNTTKKTASPDEKAVRKSCFISHSYGLDP